MQYSSRSTIIIYSNAVNQSHVEFSNSDWLEPFGEKHINPRFTGRKCIENIKNNTIIKNITNIPIFRCKIVKMLDQCHTA